MELAKIQKSPKNDNIIWLITLSVITLSGAYSIKTHSKVEIVTKIVILGWFNKAAKNG